MLNFHFSITHAANTSCMQSRHTVITCIVLPAKARPTVSYILLVIVIMN